jgi:hypothetical protein
MLSKGVQTLPILGIYSAMSRDNHKIESAQPYLIQSKTLTDQALESISVNGFGTTLFRNRQTESGTIEPVGSGKYQKQSI